VTQYSDKEREEWLVRWKKLVPLLTTYPYSVFLSVVFKTEVKNTAPDILAQAFSAMVSSGAVKVGYCVENEVIEVCAKHMDMNRTPG
jgi:hypothetical protein